MITSDACLSRYGDPENEHNMQVWHAPAPLMAGKLPAKIYCNRDLIGPLEAAFGNVIERGLIDEIDSWDGCFNIRKKRGGTTHSLHSWGIAFDINAAGNAFGKPPTMSPALVACFTDAGFDWGGNWSKPDGMHFQLAKFPETDYGQA
ncbi:MAG: M15 family peptidase [Methylococcaceae bacterium]|nr:MAG: M15 family peptidase [Methylococcaceae bacterium]